MGNNKIKKIIKSTVTFTLALSFGVTNIIQAEDSVYIPYDRLIFNSPVLKAYTGFENGDKLISNISFNDTVNHTYGEYIAELGALDIVKGSGLNYYPNENISNIDALTGILRMNGLDKDAFDRIEVLANNNPNLTNTELHQLAFAQVGLENGYLTNQEFASVQVTANQNTEPLFDKDADVSRERLAFWIGHLITLINPEELDKQTIQSINKYTDFQDITPSYINEIEDVTSLDIMNFDGNMFYPKNPVTRGEYAMFLSNIDKIYYDYKGFEKKLGFVGGIKTHEEKNPSTDIAVKDFYVRDSNGNVDIIRNYNNTDNIIQTFDLNTPVYKNGRVTNILALEEGDNLEYIVDNVTDKVYFISAKPQVIGDEQGRLFSIDYNQNTITIKKDRISTKTYPLSDSIISDNSIVLNVKGEHKKIHQNELPFGSIIALTLKNDVVTEITFVGDIVVEEEIQGVVLENNPDFGYLTIVDNNRQKKTYNYYSNDIIVEKQGYYGDDYIGYYDEMFQSNLYDGRDTVISNIEAGDLVFLKTFEDDPTTIESISASVNYIMRYGKIVSFVDNVDFSTIVVEYENGATDSFNISNNMIIVKEGRLISPYELRDGDYIKFLVNYAVSAPGVYTESMKELFVEGDARHISTVYKGSFAGADLAKQTLSLKDAQDLTTTSWANYSQLEELSIRNGLEIYYNNNRVDLTFLNNYAKYSDAIAYVALEKSYGGDVVKKISLFDGRDLLLDRDFISTVDGNDISLSDSSSSFEVQDSSIVIRDGRLVDINSILPQDYAHVSTNKGIATIVNITEPINNEQITLQRARVFSVDEGQSFKVSSISTYDNSSWNYSPVQKEYTIDYDTIFINETGEVRPIEEIIDYSDSTVFETAYNIFSEGTKTLLIASQPYIKEELKGTVYDIQGENIFLKDVTYRDSETKTWTTVSYENNYLTVALAPNKVIVKNSEFINTNGISIGDNIRILTDTLNTPVEPGTTVDGYVAYIEE